MRPDGGVRMIRNPQSEIRNSVTVALPGCPYVIHIGEGHLTGITSALDAQMPGAAVFVISNPKIFSLYGSGLLAALRKSGRRARPLLLPDGERYKTLRSAERLYGALI